MSITPAEFAEKAYPEDTQTSRALRAIIVEALTQYEAEKTGEPARRITATTDPYLIRINSPRTLEAFRLANNLRPDWHEPDEQDITAYVIGDHLDNAMGSTVDHNCGELNVVLSRIERSGSYEQLHPLAVINLATLLSWASYRLHAPEVTDAKVLAALNATVKPESAAPDLSYWGDEAVSKMRASLEAANGEDS